MKKQLNYDGLTICSHLKEKIVDEKNGILKAIVEEIKATDTEESSCIEQREGHFDFSIKFGNYELFIEGTYYVTVDCEAATYLDPENLSAINKAANVKECYLMYHGEPVDFVYNNIDGNYFDTIIEAEVHE